MNIQQSRHDQPEEETTKDYIKESGELIPHQTKARETSQERGNYLKFRKSNATYTAPRPAKNLK